MELIVAVAPICGDIPCVILPALKNGEDPKEWHQNNLVWIRKLIALSPTCDPEPDDAA